MHEVMYVIVSVSDVPVLLVTYVVVYVVSVFCVVIHTCMKNLYAFTNAYVQLNVLTSTHIYNCPNIENLFASEHICK